MSGNYTRTSNEFTGVYDSGPYEAIVTNHLDTKYMGTLEVELIRYTGAGGTPQRSGQLLNVKYLSPFYGVTPVFGLKEEDGYQNTQKSYGWWAVPPDIGTRVLVIFAEGNANFGYWIGCIQDDYMNFMIPDGRASTTLTTEVTPQPLKGAKLPVGEYNKKIETGELIDPTLFNKPYNKDFSNILEIQGLIFDETRGTTSTSARREIPSGVFGISTPGPQDKRQGAPRVDVGPTGKKSNVPYSRLGGSSFVMDDGNDKLVRATHAEDGPPLYYNRLNGETGGDETIPHNELLRFRTRTGHQILLHNSEDLIYIANSRGTAWIELTSDGKIDIHAQDSISVMSDNDINFTAERDFNIEAGRNINMKATARWSDEQQYFDSKESGRIHLESMFDTKIHVGKDYRLTVTGESDTNVGLGKKTTVKGDYGLHSNRNIRIKADATMHQKSGASTFRYAGVNMHDLTVGVRYDKSASYNLSTTGEGMDSGDCRFRINGNMDGVITGWDHKVIEGDLSLKVTGNFVNETEARMTLISAAEMFQEAGTAHNLIAGTDTFHNALGGTVNIQGATRITGDATDIHWNSGNSSSATEGDDHIIALTALNATLASDPVDALSIEPLTTITLPYMFPGAQQPVPYESILTRAPQHEPYMHHENTNPQAFKKEQTDREMPGTLVPAERYESPDTFNKNTARSNSSRSVAGSAGSSADFSGGTGDGQVTSDPNSTPPSDAQFDPNGQGKLVTVYARRAGLSCQVAEVFQKNFQDFLDEFEATGYEIKKLGGYAYRSVRAGRSWSCHASGAAIDINWPDPVDGGVNGFFRPRPPNAPITDMPANTLEIANKHGLGWGGAWRSLDDAMHFSAHTSEGGAFTFPRNGTIPAGPSNGDETEYPHPDEEQGNDLEDPVVQPEDQQNLPGPQNADGTPNADGVNDDNDPGSAE